MKKLKLPPEPTFNHKEKPLTPYPGTEVPAVIVPRNSDLPLLDDIPAIKVKVFQGARGIKDRETSWQKARVSESEAVVYVNLVSTRNLGRGYWYSVVLRRGFWKTELRANTFPTPAGGAPLLPQTRTVEIDIENGVRCELKAKHVGVTVSEIVSGNVYVHLGTHESSKPGSYCWVSGRGWVLTKLPLDKDTRRYVMEWTRWKKHDFFPHILLLTPHSIYYRGWYRFATYCPIELRWYNLWKSDQLIETERINNHWKREAAKNAAQSVIEHELMQTPVAQVAKQVVEVTRDIMELDPEADPDFTDLKTPGKLVQAPQKPVEKPTIQVPASITKAPTPKAPADERDRYSEVALTSGHVFTID
jgi:hypothetical protein